MQLGEDNTTRPSRAVHKTTHLY